MVSINTYRSAYVRTHTFPKRGFQHLEDPLLLKLPVLGAYPLRDPSRQCMEVNVLWERFVHTYMYVRVHGMGKKIQCTCPKSRVAAE